jgi:DNA polymerase-1
MKSIILIDGNSLMHRSYHGVNKGFIPLLEGKPIGMVYGFASTLLHILEQFRPDSIMVTFDTKEKTFRHELDENYKAQREAAPDDFYEQIPYIFELLESFSIPAITSPGYESDDIIGTISQSAVKEGWNVKILSNDHDFLQLVGDSIKLVKFNGKTGQSLLYGREETFARYHVYPEQMIDFKAITGDTSDNYKGIPGIGPKTAASLLQTYKTLHGIYENREQLKPNIREKFQTQKESVYHCQKLATIHTNAPVKYDLSYRFSFVPESTELFLEKMKFQSLMMRYRKLIKEFDQPKKEEHKIKSKNTASNEQMKLF